MKYKELLEKLQGLSEDQLNKDVVFWAEEEAFKVGFSILEKPMYYDEEYPEDGCFEPREGVRTDGYRLAYEAGYPILHERKNKGK